MTKFNIGFIWGIVTIATYYSIYNLPDVSIFVQTAILIIIYIVGLKLSYLYNKGE